MLPVPFQPQVHPAGCGAAALAMVYSSLGLHCSQEELWPGLSRAGAGSSRARTHLLARDALARGFSAVIVRVRQPWETLTACLRDEVRVILHHRLTLEDGAGHYSVLVDLDASSITVHDPRLGAAVRSSREEFQHLWSPTQHSPEVVGNVLVAIASSTGVARCPHCGDSYAESVRCIACQGEIPLRPAAALGCVHERCGGRRFDTCYCPTCDMSLWWLHRHADPRSRE